ncbi:hypothetical protein [Slackia heliotrinireducens]|jgi:hypothetical protein|uniref:Uncharacterized protein n=1 Tax=Slackia heliotrinireducens (strain ATCC 29202 / DSM 20476 / NCTC 11029 / RHS 1) TaxID=471855 RepID=C7N8A7_SLAHD|nr:hypothetical protein [Slackia heliotrinireducens]ACV23142.1 hypothetical protein Shel_21320 [Slackia heliotrinireducens DSM 20476]
MLSLNLHDGQKAESNRLAQDVACVAKGAKVSFFRRWFGMPGLMRRKLW